MRVRIRNEQDFWAGALFAAIGLAGLGVGASYPIGEATRMGPGYFPAWVGGLAAVLGALIALRALAIDGPKIGGIAWRPTLLLVAAFALFGWGIERLGLVASLAGVIIVSTAASRGFRLAPAAVLAAAMVAVSWLIFVYALGLPLRLWWW